MRTAKGDVPKNERPSYEDRKGGIFLRTSGPRMRTAKGDVTKNEQPSYEDRKGGCS